MNLLTLTALIFIFNVMTFGNGPVMIPLLQHNLVDTSHVLTNDQLLYAFAIARITPGPANVYVTSVGYFLYGVPGALTTTLAITVPGYLMLPLLKEYERIRAKKVVKNFTRGLTAASIGLIVAVTVQIAKSTLTNLVAWLIFPFTFVLTFWLKLNPLLSLAIATGMGLLLKIWL